MFNSVFFLLCLAVMGVVLALGVRMAEYWKTRVVYSKIRRIAENTVIVSLLLAGLLWLFLGPWAWENALVTLVVVSTAYGMWWVVLTTIFGKKI